MAMRISYKPLFSVECLHGYFADNVCKALTLSPAPAWDRLRQRYQLLFRPFAGGGTVYYSEQAQSDLARLRSEPLPVTFALTSTDPLFDIYTESGDSGNAALSGTVRYFSNRKEHVADVTGRTRRLLHPLGQPLAQPPLPVRASRFTHRFAQPVHAVEVQVLDAFGQPVWQTQTPPFDVRDWPIDLRGLACGRYQLVVAGRSEGDFYLSDEPAVRQWGVVEIFLKDIDRAPTFTISFASRETVWRYYIFDQPQGESLYAGHEVVGVQKRSGPDRSSDRDIRFTKRTDSVTVNGRPAFVFESEQTVPLAEIPSEDDCQFTFRANGRISERGGRPIKLPFARPGTTKLDVTPDGVRMFSEIFVYL